MKRITLITSTTAMVLAVALLPAVASAHGHHHRHHRRGSRARLESFGTSNPTAPASASAGTVMSFSGGVLTIKLADSSSVTGKVTVTTELKCETAPASGMARMADHSGNEGGSVGDANEQDANDADEFQSPTTGQPVTDDDNGTGDNEDEQCTMSSLKEGATVRSAELAITSAGSTFLEVEIIL
jgi:hypothetical protein